MIPRRPAGDLAAQTVRAADGVLEINQTCAVQTGCFAGDIQGFPVTIDGSAGRSYRLTGDLVVPNENTDGIQISTENVSIDLAGFEIGGPVVCSGALLACVPATGTGSGVDVTLATLSGIAVRYGSIRGMGTYGVSLGVQAEVTNLRVRTNRLSGIFASPGSTVSGNTAFGNGGATNPNDDDGIQCLRGCIVRGNSVRSNGGFGLKLLSDSAYSDNVVTANSTGTVTGSASANGRGGNYCSGTGTVSDNCP